MTNAEREPGEPHEIVREDAQYELLEDPQNESRYVELLDQLLISAGCPTKKISIPIHFGEAKKATLAVVERDETYRAAVDIARRAAVELAIRTLSRLEGKPLGGCFDALFQGIGAGHSKPEMPLTLFELIQRYDNDPSRANLSQKSRNGYRVILEVLAELLGSTKDIKSITREDCRSVQEVLLALPPNASKRFPKLTLPEAASHARAHDLPTLSATAINSYLNNLAALFNYAVKERYLDHNPAKGLTVREPVHKRERKDPFTVEQLNSIFTSSDFVRWRIASPGKFWVPLLSLFHGLRSNEACQLLVSDVTTRDGTPVILVQPDDREKRVKSRAGTRFIPLHPEVIRFGFLGYVKKVNGERLFPDLNLGRSGYYSDPFGKAFNRFLRRIGVKVDSRTSLHSFRHNFRDALREANITVERVRALGGWTDQGGAEAIYGCGFKASTLAAEITKVCYPGLDLSHLIE